MKYSLLDIFNMYINSDYSKVFYRIEENYNFNIHGNYYKRVLTISDRGIYCRVYNIFGDLANYSYIDLENIKNSKPIWLIKE